MSDTTGIYDDGAAYGPDPDATTPADPIYDDGAVYGAAADGQENWHVDETELTRRVIAASSPPAVDDLTTFLRKRIAEDQAIAEECTGPDWRVDQGDGNNAEHIARHDPTRVLAEADAKLAVLRELGLAVHGQPRPYIDALLFVIQQMGLAYADNPDYKENWRP